MIFIIKRTNYLNFDRIVDAVVTALSTSFRYLSSGENINRGGGSGELQEPCGLRKVLHKMCASPLDPSCNILLFSESIHTCDEILEPLSKLHGSSRFGISFDLLRFICHSKWLFDFSVLLRVWACPDADKLLPKPCAPSQELPTLVPGQ